MRICKKCQFYDNNNYDQYYKSDMLCGIKREKDVVKLGDRSLKSIIRNLTIDK
ncbi:protein of unknown function [Candidatus Nitrosotalea okcheonensis]|uniref:Uncharacterized protein n=1 Tax=Candidatus Nitrosotalea okcheonensis TaxID=1903276 RepID=A0A2H1FEQ9_9ARCH|nr:protein of unknown function [Candidatus Nitrosotalea okcheonensis]